MTKMPDVSSSLPMHSVVSVSQVTQETEPGLMSVLTTVMASAEMTAYVLRLRKATPTVNVLALSLASIVKRNQSLPTLLVE